MSCPALLRVHSEGKSKLLNFQLKSCYSNRSRFLDGIIFYFTTKTLIGTCGTCFPLYLVGVQHFSKGDRGNLLTIVYLELITILVSSGLKIISDDQSNFDFGKVFRACLFLIHNNSWHVIISISFLYV